MRHSLRSPAKDGRRSGKHSDWEMAEREAVELVLGKSAVTPRSHIHSRSATALGVQTRRNRLPALDDCHVPGQGERAHISGQSDSSAARRTRSRRLKIAPVEMHVLVESGDLVVSKVATASLIIAPHVDDEALGCGGVLDETCHVHFCGLDESLLADDPRHRIPAYAREEELASVAAHFGYSYSIDRCAKVNHYQVPELITALESVINERRPHTIYLPFAGGYNQDHQAVFRAAQVALRPHDRNHFVKRVLIYEAIHDHLWSTEPFQAAYFVPIDIDRKLAGYELHASQVRSMRSGEMIRTHARMRGMMAGCEYAEAFMVQRWVA